MIDYGHGTIGFVLTAISLIFGLLGCAVSLMIGISIIYYQCYHSLKREEKITLVVSFHNYSFIFIVMILLVSVNIQTLIGDISGNNFYSS